MDPVTFLNATKTTYNDVVGNIQDISPLIDMISPHDAPLLQVLGGLRDTCTNTKHEWMEDELVPASDTLHGALDIDDLTPVTVHNGKIFRADDVIKIGNEVMLVASVSGDALTVAARGYGSTDAATHADNAVITRIGVAKKEGADFLSPRTTEKVSDYNVTQIFEETISVTGTAQAIKQYGVPDKYARELMKKLTERARDVELAAVHGIRYNDTGNQRRTMGGLLEFLVENNVAAGSAEITKPLMDDLIKDIWSAGGMPKLLVMNATQKLKLSNAYADSMRTDRTERTLGGFITTFENDFGTFDILLDRWVPEDMIMVIDPAYIGIGPLEGRNWSHRMMPLSGDYIKGVLLAELTMEVRLPQAHGIIKGLSVA